MSEIESVEVIEEQTIVEIVEEDAVLVSSSVVIEITEPVQTVVEVEIDQADEDLVLEVVEEVREVIEIVEEGPSGPPGPQGPPGEGGEFPDMPDLTLIYENALVGGTP